MGVKKVFWKKVIALLLVVGLLVPGATSQTASAKKRIAISHKRLVMKVGAKKKLKIKNTKKKVKWSSKNKKIAVVSKKGVVKAKKKGTVKIIAKVGKKSFTCKVTVKSKNTTKSPNVTSTKKPTPAPNPTPVPEPTLVPTPTPDPHWAEGKKSGTEEDYYKYFDVKLNTYQFAQEGTVKGTMESITYHSEVVGADREAYVYLPPNYSKDKKYPVLYLLHGFNCDREQWNSMQVNAIISNMICNREVKPLVAVIPSIVPKEGLANEDYGARVEAFNLFDQEFYKDLEPYILKNYSVSSDRKDTGICGLSMGGMETLRLAFSVKDHFNYIGSFSAPFMMEQDMLSLEGWNTVPELIMVCNGSEDSDSPLRIHEKFEENNVDHIWYICPGLAHETRVWKNGLINLLKRAYR